MAITNNYLPFCPTDTGTNLLTNSEYSLASDRTNGNQPGVASSKLVNKALRQSSNIASQLAQYLGDRTNTNVLDDGNLANILALMNAGFAANQVFDITNLCLAASVGSNQLTIAVKTKLNADPSATDFITAGFRSATITSGLYLSRTLAAAQSLVISNGSTLGQSNGVASNIYVYLIDNAGTLELAVSKTLFSEDALVSTTAEGGAGAADSATTMYSQTARSNVACRLVGILTNTQATAGTWLTAPSQIQLYPFQGFKSPTQQRFTSGSGTYVTPAGAKFLRVRMVGGGGGGSGSGTSGGGNGSAGGASTFGTSLLTCNAGAAGNYTATTGGAGGSATINPPAFGTAMNGNGGSGYHVSLITGSASFGGMMGGSGGFSAGTSRTASANIGGTAGTASANSGSGGAGAANGATGATNFGGTGGGAGGFIDAIIPAPLNGTYAYSVGTGGSGGSAGTNGGSSTGGDGGSGYIEVTEFY